MFFILNLQKKKKNMYAFDNKKEKIKKKKLRMRSTKYFHTFKK